MAASISLGVTVFPVGSRQFEVDSLPADSEGFELVLGIGAAWRATSPGPLARIDVEISLNGSTFQPWISVQPQGGDVRTPTGAQLTEWSMKGFWPGEHDGSANPFGRRKLRGLALRATVTVFQAFQAESVLLRTI
jgi:hypothetical protein